MATIQKLRTKVKSLLLSISAAFITLSFFFNFLIFFNRNFADPVRDDSLLYRDFAQPGLLYEKMGKPLF